MRLPEWTKQQLAAKKVKIERYGRNQRGRPSMEDSRWYFCGWYWHREEKRRVTEGPHGPFPCWSAAVAHALTHYGLDYADRVGSNRV